MRKEKEFKLRYSVSCILYTELYSFHWAFTGRLVCATFIYIVGCFPFSLYLPQFGLRGGGRSQLSPLFPSLLSPQRVGGFSESWKGS